jgi:hypothetical protein
MVPKNLGENISCVFLCSVYLLRSGVGCYAATRLIVALSPGNSDISRFRPSSPVATGNNEDRAVEIPKVAQTTGTDGVFYPRSDILRLTSWRASVCQILTNDGPNHLK